MKKGQNAALPVASSSTRRGINVFAKAGSPVIAVQDGKIVKMGRTDRLGKFIQLRDVYGNTYTYAHLKKLSIAYPVPKEKTVSKTQVKKELHLAAPGEGPQADRPGQRRHAGQGQGARRRAGRRRRRRRDRHARRRRRPRSARSACSPTPAARAPTAPAARSSCSTPAASSRATRPSSPTSPAIYGLKRYDVVLKKLKPGSKVIAGTILGRIGRTEQKMAPHMLFEVRPAGRGAPRIDPKPILDGWKLLESTAIYRAAGKNPFWGPDSKNPSIGQILLMSKEALQHRVLTDPAIDIYDCGRRDIQAGGIDRRVLATLEFLVRQRPEADGQRAALRPQLPDHLGQRVRALLGQRRRHRGDQRDPDPRPPGPGLDHRHHHPPAAHAAGHDEAPPDHLADDLRRGRQHALAARPQRPHPRGLPAARTAPTPRPAISSTRALKPSQWVKLIDRLGKIDNPTVPIKPSKYALKVPKRASKAHVGE